jgi:general secretion pathway protein G
MRTANGTKTGRRQRGFTLLELMIVVGIIAIIASLALPYYRGAKKKAQEAVLKEDLWILRDVIDQYFADKGRYPSDLETLVAEGYLKDIPKDPFTESRDTWETVEVNQGDEGLDEEQIQQGGVYDVRSGATGQASDGSYYRDW